MRNNRNKPREKHSPKSHRENSSLQSANKFLDELKADVAAFFEINNKDSFTQADVLEHFDVGDRKMKLIIHGLIGELVEEGRLTRLENGSYQANEEAGTIEGVVDHVNQKFAFVITPDGDRETDIYVPTEELAGAIDGDRVRVMTFSDSGNRGRRVEGRVTEIVDRGRTEVVGRIQVWATYGFVVPDSKKLYEDIHIAKEKLGGAKDGDKVIVRLTKFPDERKNRFEGEVITVLGPAGQNNTEMHAILAEFGLPITFPEAIEKEAEAIPTKISKKDLARRRDFREVTTFTIDPVDAKDFDDALSVQMLENGNYEIGVHIADVTHYVRPGTLLEEEAYKRATSVYLVDRVVPMLPEKLSNNLCSLRPHEDKLTFSAVFELTPEAKIVKEWFGRTIIHSDRRFAYEEAQEIMDMGVGDYVEELQLLNSLALKLRDERFSKGAINFETVEVRFKLDENGVPLSVHPKIRQDAHKLIEEFMLLANKQVAEFVHGLSKGTEPNTMVYRVHEGPDEARLQVFAEFVKRFGYKIKVDEAHLSSSLNNMIENLEGKPEQNMLQQLAVRTMAKARYSTEDIGHFGLAFKRYSHFTSPIRRYPDMMAHRLLQHYLDKGKSADREEYEAKSKHSSERERMATEAERASIKYKQVEFMSRMDPTRTFEGIISGVTDFGIFVEITENSCEGLVRMNDLTDDFYEFDKDNYRLVGRRTKKFYTFGDAITVKVKETNLGRRSIDFWLVDDHAKHLLPGSERGRKSRRGSDNSNGQSKRSRDSSGSGRRKEGTAAKGENRRGGRKQQRA
ncbi:ribonuclease R [Nibrella saemangeumensis]|uniref:Ribonuclease R n=1 Tax=Nibrella saemangeumensis TaxID=1084526 RepID=A0ABP8ME29_9BACT